jgi:hypothetical protein
MVINVYFNGYVYSKSARGILTRIEARWEIKNDMVICTFPETYEMLRKDEVPAKVLDIFFPKP